MFENLSAMILNIIFKLPVALIALPVHEAAHAFTAYKLGDKTAKNAGRLTLNPLKHIDPLGFLFMLFAGFGWARPVPVNMNNFKKPRVGFAITSLMGPVSNLLLALLSIIILHVITLFSPTTMLIKNAELYKLPNISSVTNAAVYLLSIFAQINAVLAVFNMLPIPPLDGSRLASLILPKKYYYSLLKYERYIWFFLIFLLFIGVLGVPISYMATKITQGLYWLVGLAFKPFAPNIL